MKKYLILFLFFLASFSVHVYAVNENEDIPKLTLTGQATLQKPSDTLLMTIGVVNTGSNAQEALSQNSMKMQAVIDALEDLGLAKSEYHTGHFSIIPTYTPHPKNPPPDWKPSINGYEVNNSIIVKTDKLHLAGQIIDTANRAGANEITNIHFTLKDLRKYWDEVLTQATQNAFSDAKIIADAAGVKIQRVLSVSLNNTNVITPKISNVYARAMSAEAVVPPIEPGEIDMTASITVVFEIGSN